MSLPSAGGPASASSAPGEETSSSALGASQEMGKDEFLRLLVAQLGNQDPMNPMKGQEFAAQLAQFTSVEQLTNINTQLEEQKGTRQALMQSVNGGVAAGLIGREVEAAGNTVSWRDEGQTTLGLELSDPAEEVTVTIRDAAGNPVMTHTLEDVEEGAEKIKWDGTSDEGSRVPEGTYSFEVEATDSGGDPIGARTFLSGAVDRVTFGEEGTMLWVDGTKVPMGQVRSVKAP